MPETPVTSIKVTDWCALRRVVYYDTDYPSSWVRNSAELVRAFIDGGGYAPLSAFQLREWMLAQISGGADGSICFFSQDIAPDVVAEERDNWAPGQNSVPEKERSPSPACLVMDYIRAGGRVVWVGDIPFYYLGRRGRTSEDWGLDGQKTILGLDSISDLREESRLTEAGREWGLTAAEPPSRCVPAALVTAALTRAGEYAVSFFKNYNPDFPQSGFLRLREFMPPRELLKAAQYGIEEETEEAGFSADASGPAGEAGGVLVSSGSFVVDRARALDKLMRFQLPNPDTCLLPLMRCAMAGKASGISVQETTGGGLEIKFDGAPFTFERLKDPYAALFESRTAANAAARQLAVALLSALRLGPMLITVASGSPGARCRLKIEALGRESIQPSEDPGTGTIVRFVWPGSRTFLRPAKHLISHLEKRCALSPVPILINGRDIPRSREEGTGPGVYFEQGPLHGFITVPRKPASSSRLSAAAYNVLLDTPLSASFAGAQVSGYLNNDDFTLNISQTGVVNNSRCSKALAAVSSRVPELIRTAARFQRETLPGVARTMLYGKMHAHWKKWMEEGREEERGLFGTVLKGVKDVVFFIGEKARGRWVPAVLKVRGSARVTQWLRSACDALIEGREGDPADPLKKVLWETPLFPTTSAGVMSFAQISAQYKKMGFIPYSVEPYPDLSLPFEVIWCVGESDIRALRRWETADITERIKYYGGDPAAAEEFLGGIGPRLFSIRHDITIIPPERPARSGMRPVDISLADFAVRQPEKIPAPPPAPAGPALKPAAPGPVNIPPEPLPAASALKPPLPPIPTLEAIARDPAAYFPEYLARKASGIRSAGARLLSGFIKERTAGAEWVKRPLAETVLSSSLPVFWKAGYLLSVFYTDFNRREVKLTDADDMNFQRALAEFSAAGGRNDDR